ncbi:MAG: hypothetical protein NTY19_46255 [Planctomycetota bacterium]|nr:hypothetical protein [Planctomycetota bacterium]
MITRRLQRGLVLASLLVCCGCATHADRLRTVRTAFYDGDLREAEQLLDRSLKKHQDGGDVLFLEKAIVQLADGHPAEAEQTLRQVRDRFDYLEQKSAAESALSTMTDDRSLAYAGEDYEKVLIRGFLALSSLLHGGEDAGAYSLQMIDTQAQIIQAAAEPDGKNLKAGYQQVALGPYLRALLREETHHDYDDVARYRAMVVSWAPGFTPGPADLTRAQDGNHSAPGHGVLQVFTLVGRGPYKEQVDEVPSSTAVLIADRIISSIGKYTLPPTIASIKVPKVMAGHNLIQAVGVSVDGRPGGETNTITDVSQMAVAQYDAIFPKVVARAVVRRAIKKSVVYGAKEALGAQRGSLLSLPLDVVGVAWEATERADTRCWGLLPDKIQVRRIELPVGEHEVALCPLDAGYRPIGPAATRRVTISDGRSTFLLATFPGTHLVGQMLISPE